MSKRGYKLQEFVAHSGNVNCLRFGKKTRRQFLTGGDDQIVNLWSIGKPTFTARLSGHTSPVESVAFDSGEVLVVAGASSGLIKLWDLQETKVVRTLTGHRSYCTALEFHPFGEFFASGSMDTNLKIWDIRKKGCIHTYKGHSRAISTIRFTPDGRWVVSGGFDNVVKVWDLTAGKLLHDFKFHEGHIRSIDFHPLEFLLATGSADRTVNFWDLETFELIGSSKREAAGVRSMTFHPDGRTLFCGLDNNLKVYSWEPVLCHDSVEMGWSTLSDLCISDGKLVGGAYYQNTIGVWVADISQIEPFGAGLTPEKQHNMEQKQECRLERVGSNRSLKTECLLERVASDRSSNSSLRCTSPDIDSKDIKNIYVDSENPVTIKKVTCHMRKAVPASDSIESNKQSSQKINSFVDLPAKPNGLLVDKSQKPSHIKRLSSNNFDMEKISVTLESESAGSLPTQVDCTKESNIDNRLMIDNNSREYSKAKDSDVEHGGEKLEKTSLDNQENRKKASEGRKELHPVRVVNGVAVVRGRTRSLVERFEKREGLNIDDVHKLDSKTEQAEVCASPPSSCKDEEPEMATSHFKAKEATLPLPPAVDEANTCASPCNIEELEASHMPASSPCYVEELEASHMPASQFKSEQVEVSCSEAEEVAASPLPVSQVKSMDARKSRLPASRSKAGELEASPIPVSQVKHENVRRSRLPYSRSKTEELEAPVSQFKSGARTSRMSVFRSKAEQAKTSRLLASRSKAEEPQTIRCLTSSSNAQEPQTFRCLSVSSNAEEPQTAPLLNTDERALPRCESVQNDNIVFEDLMQNHDVLLSTFRSRLTKLQVVRHFWERNDIKGAINALRKLPDLSVQADVVSVLVDKMDIITLDLFSCLLPILLSLLDSKVERHVNVSVELLMKLVAVFGPVVRSAVSAPPSVGVDLHAEERIKCCRQCFALLQDMQKILPALIRRGGLLAKGALQLNLLLQES